MTKVILSQNVAQIDGLSGRRYGGNTPGRVFDMEPGDAKAVVKLGGSLASMTGVTCRAIGYRCQSLDCGLGRLTRICSRCGGDCERE